MSITVKISGESIAYLTKREREHRNLINIRMYRNCFSFPQNPFQKEKWIEATGRQNWMPTKSSTICSDHFNQNDFVISKKGLKYVNTTAIPTQKVVIVMNVSKI